MNNASGGARHPEGKCARSHRPSGCYISTAVPASLPLQDLQKRCDNVVTCSTLLLYYLVFFRLNVPACITQRFCLHPSWFLPWHCTSSSPTYGRGRPSDPLSQRHGIYCIGAPPFTSCSNSFLVGPITGKSLHMLEASDA